MGLSTSIAAALLIFGILAAIVVAYPFLESGLTTVFEAFMERQNDYSDKQQTSLEVLGITVDGTCSDYNLTVRVNNTGGVGIRFGKAHALDNNEMLVLGNTSITERFYSSRNSDGYITYDTSTYVVENGLNNSQVGKNRTGGEYEQRSYLSFNTSRIGGDEAVLEAELYAMAAGYYTDTSPTWTVGYYYGSDVIGDTLTQAAWGNFNSLGSLDYEGTTGWKDVSVPAAYINKNGDTDFELRPTWSINPNQEAVVELVQTEQDGNNYDPYLEVTYAWASPLEGVLAPSKDINMIYYDMSSADSKHTIAIVTENGISAYGSYECSG